MKFEHICSQNDANSTVKQLIARKYALSARTLSKLKSCGGIRVNGKTVTVRYVLSEGDILSLELPEATSQGIEPCNIALDIIYEDSELLAVNKPKGMPTHPSHGHRLDTLANAVMYYYRDIPFTFRAVTRLDADTTGIVLIAKNAPCCARLSALINKDKIKKQYAAVCDGIPAPLSGIIDAPVSRDGESIIKRRVSSDGKRAVTRYETEKILCGGKYSLVKLFPETGRTHQLRLHLSHIGCPIHGDFLYGTQNSPDERALLHCESLSVPLRDGEELKLYAPLPDDMKFFTSD